MQRIDLFAAGMLDDPREAGEEPRDREPEHDPHRDAHMHEELVRDRLCSMRRETVREFGTPLRNSAVSRLELKTVFLFRS